MTDDQHQADEKELTSRDINYSPDDTPRYIPRKSRGALREWFPPMPSRVPTQQKLDLNGKWKID